jgi:7-carboxy-7-deazaguanine synthase
MSVEEVVDKVQKFAPHYKDWVCITGGEPMFQLDSLHELVKTLKKYGYRVTVETNGSIKKPYWWTLVDSWNFDIKCPSSGVCGISLEDWFETRGCDQAKFVVGTREDLDFARKVIMKHMVHPPVVLVSPVSGILVNKEEGTLEEYWFKPWLQEVAEFCLTERVRLSLQIHKVIWGNKKGV